VPLSNRMITLAVICTLTIAGCSQNSVNEKMSQKPIKATSAQSDEPQTATQQTSNKAPNKTIAPETLYDLLIAEMGGKVNRLEIALGNYMRQAHLTKDPAVIERYAKIANYMQASQATLDATQLWLKIDPKNVEALTLMLVYQIGQGSLKEQEEALHKLLRQTADLDLLLLEQQLNASSNEQRIVFLQVLEKLTNNRSAQYKDNANLWYLMAKTQSLLDRPNEVITSVQQQHKIDNQFLPSYILLVDAYEKTNQVDLAEKALKKLTTLDPANKKVRLYYARLLVRSQKYKAALNEFESLVKDFPTDYDLQLTSGVLAAQSGQFTTAMAYFQGLLDKNHRTNETLLQIAIIQELQNNPKEAITNLLLITPSDFFQEARFKAAKLTADQGKVDEAILILEEAAKQQALASELYTISIAELYSEYGQSEKALKHLNNAIKKSPDIPSFLYSRAILLSELNQHQASEADLRKVLKLKPDNVAALNALGYTLVDRNIRLDEASVLLEKAHKLSPNDAPILDSLGWLEYRLGNLAKAKKRLREAFDILKDHEIAAHLGEILWLVGEQSEAKAIWNEGLKLKPDSQILKDTMQRLIKQ